MEAYWTQEVDVYKVASAAAGHDLTERRALSLSLSLSLCSLCYRDTGCQMTLLKLRTR